MKGRRKSARKRASRLSSGTSLLDASISPVRKKTLMNVQRSRVSVVAVGLTVLALTASASENVPHRPYAMWADVPEQGQFILGVVYEESEAYHIWAGRTYHNITVRDDGEDYGIDINQGYIALQYGITEKLAADLNFGYTTAGWR